jgi:nucleoside-diphosphate-sugar epimerase
MVNCPKSKILVTGGAGFIGSHLVEELINRGNKVRVLDNLSSGSKANLLSISLSVDLVVGDIRDKEIVNSSMKDIDYVFHLAGLASVPMSQEDPELCLDINGHGTLNVLKAASDHKVKRLVYASTSAVYGDLPAPHDENTVPHPNTPYAAVKLLGENFALFFQEQKGLKTVCLRYFNVYGPRQSPDGPDSGVIPLFILAFKKGESPVIYGDGTQTRDFIHVKDVVRATILASTSQNAGGVYNIATGEPVSINSLTNALFNLSPKDYKEPNHAKPRPGDPSKSYANITKAKEDLNFVAQIPLAQGLKELFEEK